MRKFYFLSILSLLLAIKSFGQISLVSNNLEAYTSEVLKFTNVDGTNGFAIQKDSNMVAIYNNDFSLNRTIRLSIPNLKNIEGFGLYNGIDVKGLMASTHLFNNNAALEFAVTLYNKQTGLFGFAIVDENSNVLFTKQADAGVGYIYFSLMTAENKIYLLVCYENQDYTKKPKTEVYSLPGTERFDGFSGSSSITTPNPQSVISPSKVFAYPNPSGSTVNLAYTLPEGNQGTLSVYDLSGKCLKTMTVDGAFPSVSLDVSGYAPATYIYKVECNGTTVSEKFIVSR